MGLFCCYEGVQKYVGVNMEAEQTKGGLCQLSIYCLSSPNLSSICVPQ